MNIDRASGNIAPNELVAEITQKVQRTRRKLNDNNESMDAKLRRAAAEGKHGDIEGLINQGAGINNPDINGWTPLHFACNNGHVKAVNLLVEKGADVNLCDDAGATPLHIASNGDDPSITASIVNRDNKTLEATTAAGETPLFVACKKGNEQLV